MGEYFVFIVKDTIVNNTDSAKAKDSSHKNKTDTAANKGPQLLAFEKKVQLGQTIGANVVVTKGLTDGEKIIVDGIQQLHDGLAVNPGKPRGAANKDDKHNSKESDNP